jgi:pyruvate dehydrogenase E1 component
MIVRDGLRRMYDQNEDVFYYITIYNENVTHPAMPDGVEQGIVRGLYRFRAPEAPRTHEVQLFGSGSIMQSVLEAQKILGERFDVAAHVWSAPSYQQLRNEALSIDRWNRLHPEAPQRKPYVVEVLEGVSTPIIAATDYS